MAWVSKQQRERTENAFRAARYAERRYRKRVGTRGFRISPQQLEEARARLEVQNAALLEEAKK